MSAVLKELLDNSFGRFIDLTDEAYEFLLTCFELKTYAPRTLLVEAGSVARYFYLVKSGVQTMYIINQKGEKVVLGFTYKGAVSGAYDSFITKENCEYFMEAITYSELYALNYQQFQELFSRFSEFYQWRACFMEEILFGRGRREAELLTRSAKERFDAFVKRCPPELLQIPQKLLASYLNMKPETFSRLRGLKD